jgi:CRP/FNR family transcriptional regulator
MSGFLNRNYRTLRLNKTGGSLTFSAGVRLFDTEHPPRCLYLLHAGSVQLLSGRKAIVAHLSPGDFFGEKYLLTSGRSGQIAKSLMPIKVSVWRKSQLLRGMQGDRRFIMRLLRNLALRLDRSEVAIRDFVTAQAETRLARLLFRFVPTSVASGGSAALQPQ